MTPGQMRVFVLIIVLLILEVVIHPGVKEFLAGAVNQWNTALANTPGSKQ